MCPRRSSPVEIKTFRLSGLYAATRDDQWLDLDSKNKLRFIHKHVKSLDKYHLFFVNVIGG